jgi:tetratricopeptide (TPR) repeat protein
MGGWGGGVRNNYFGGAGWRGWGAPYYGNWYRGGWGGNGFWAGFGAGALTTFGLGALGSAFAYPGYGYGYGYPYSAYGVYSYFPTWGMSNYAGWGLGSVANNWLYSGYTNPYYSTMAAAQPAQTTVIYDYSQPINVAAAPPAEAAASNSEQLFSTARDAFKAGDYSRALDLTDQSLKDSPNVPVVHEFRALCLFALKRYDEAAAVSYAVLSAGPGWNWATLVGLYPDVDTYTNQLRALEAQVQANANSPSLHFLLGYHYMVEGFKDASADQFARVVQLQPSDQLSASFVKALKKVAEQPAPTSVAATGGQASEPGQTPPKPPTEVQAQAASGEQPAEPPPPPPASLVGTWKSQPSADVSIVLTLQADGKFTWEVTTKGEKQTLEGQAGYKDNTLALLQAEGPPLVGAVTEEGGNKFVFAPPGADAKSQGITFTKT